MTIEENELLKRGNFLGTKAGSLILVHESEWVGEFEEEHVAIVLYMAPESEKFSLSIITMIRNLKKLKKRVLFSRSANLANLENTTRR